MAKEERSPKVKCDMYIDDRNVGGLPDWGTIYDMITNNLTYETINPALQREDSGKKKKKGWLF